MTQPPAPPVHSDPWRDILPRCHVQSDSPHFHEQLRELLAGQVELLDPKDTVPRAAVLVDTRMDASELAVARERFASLPLVGVVATPDAARIIEALATGADGVIALTDTLKAWRECLHVVLGGGRWLGGPGLEISLEEKHASYDIARGERHSGDVTLRTKLFVRSRLSDKFRP
jgi:DNA-binding NarL/FixJ family response regulator